MRKWMVLAVAALMLTGSLASATGLAPLDTLPPLQSPTDVPSGNPSFEGKGVDGSAEQPGGGLQPMPTPQPVAPSGIGCYSGALRVTTSSDRINDNRSIHVDGEMAVDGNLDTAWNTNDRIEGEWIELSVQDGRRYAISGFRIANGYWKSSKVYNANSRVRTLDVYCDGAYVQTFSVAESKGYQTFRFNQPVTGQRVRFQIVDAFRGGKYKDVAITELELIGPGSAGLSNSGLSDWGSAVNALAQQLRSGRRLTRGDKSQAVAGLQLLLKEGFGLFSGDVDGEFGSDTQKALNGLQDILKRQGHALQTMTSGVADAALWANLVEYLQAAY